MFWYLPFNSYVGDDQTPWGTWGTNVNFFLPDLAQRICMIILLYCCIILYSPHCPLSFSEVGPITAGYETGY